MKRKHLLWGLITLAAIGALILTVGFGSGGTASITRLVAEEPGLLRFKVTDPAGRLVAGARGRFIVEKVRGGSPWLFTSYLPAGPVLEGPFAAPQGTVELRLTLWDPGRYRVVYTVETVDGHPAGGSMPVSVRPSPAKLRNTVLLFGVLVLLGLASGYAAGSLRRPTGFGPGRREVAGGLALLLLVAGLAAVARPGAVHNHGMSAPAGAGREGEAGTGRLLRVVPAGSTVKEPVRIAMPAGPALSLMVRRDEDGLVFLRQEVRGYGGPAVWTMVFPDGARYTLEAAAGADREMLHLNVSPMPPDGGRQARSFAVMAGLYAVAAAAGFGWARRRGNVLGESTFSP